jgi:hypothetical protein
MTKGVLSTADTPVPVHGGIREGTALSGVMPHACQRGVRPSPPDDHPHRDQRGESDHREDHPRSLAWQRV